jgi:putative alpha-1,2-mannosidase
VGLSFINSAQACQNAEVEIPDFDFDSTQAAAVALWTEKLAPIRVSRTGVDASVLTNFYSGIYRTFVNPQNYTGENPLWSSAEPYFDSFYWYVNFRRERAFPDKRQSLGFIQITAPFLNDCGSFSCDADGSLSD